MFDVYKAISFSISAAITYAVGIKLLYNKLMRQTSNALLQFLATSSEPSTYQQIAEETGLKSPRSALSKLKKKGLIDNTGKNQWVITNKGRELFKKQPEKPTNQRLQTSVTDADEVPVTMEDTFRKAGQMLWFRDSKQQQHLESIIYYVRRIAGFEDPIAIWNALCDWELTPTVQYTWLRMYLAMAGVKEFPAELQEKYLSLVERKEKDE
jgi:hypothetical protein